MGRKKQILEQAALKRKRRRSISRRRKKKLLPRPRIGKTHVLSLGLLQEKQRIPEPLVAPADFRLLKNTIACVDFFKLVRSRKGAVRDANRHWVLNLDLSGIEHIDFASTMMLDAICKELSTTKPACYVYGQSPRNTTCRQYLWDSGFLNNKYDLKGRKYTTSSNSVNMKIERGNTRIEDADIQSVVDIEKRICKHVTGSLGKKYRHINMIKEICGNTVDWSEAQHDQWIYGAKFENNKVILVAVDLGKGILESINRKFAVAFKEWFDNKSDLEILEGAYERKYGSKSGRKNRNRGLPSIKYAQEIGDIKDLVVITNNVLLDFSGVENSRIFAPVKQRGFKGTLYSWIIDSSCY